MDVTLVSGDRTILKTCREFLGELPGGPWTLRVKSPDDYGAGDEEQGICLWDFDPARPFPEFAKNRFSKRLFLVHRKDLVRFHELAGGQAAAVVLKPIASGTLDAFLNSRPASDCAPATSSLRADRDEILQCLIQTNLRLQEYDQDRTTFLTRALHDFRAPLTALSGYSDLLLAEPLGRLNENQKEVLRRMHHSARRLSRMAVGMFQLSVGRQLRLRPELSKGDLRDCVEQALHEIAPFADEKRIATTVDLGACEHGLYFEARQIEQLLINLLDNACKFTPKAGMIDIRGYPFFWERRVAGAPVAVPQERRSEASQGANAYRVDIHDSGAAIPADLLDRIFEEYVSYPFGSDRSGSGLGLAICKMIAWQHDGRIWAENSGSGPVFSFVLPFRSTRPVRQLMTEKTNYAEAV
jgi:signal transduction histidine kinase